MQNLDLRKQQVLNLKKAKGLEGKKAQVILALDFSGSMSTMYANGTVQEVVERILPLGLAFDDNEEVDFYLFEDGVVKLPNNITKDNVIGYIKKYVIGHYDMGGTNYAPVLHQIYNDKLMTGGFLGFGKKEISDVKDPIYVIFITDGDNGDKSEATRLIKEMSGRPIFIQFVGIGRASFPYLQKLDEMDGRVLDNCNFFSVKDIESMSDTELYEKLLTEFPDRYQQATTKGFIS